MAYTGVKTLAKQLGLYPSARWFFRNFLNRSALDSEKSELAFYSTFLQKDDLVFDVGANFGEKSRVLLKLGTRVVAFEPQADCFEELHARCGKHPRLTAVKAALASTPGTAKLYVRPSRGTSGLIKDWEEAVESETLVQTFTLDQMIAQHGTPRYIKIDVEGYEFEVLRGLTTSIPYVSFEYHLRDDDIRKAIACVQYMAGLGNVVVNLTPAERLDLTYPKWLSKDEFLAAFPSALPPNREYRYGDIFVRAV